MEEGSSSIEIDLYSKGTSRQICPMAVAGRYLATDRCMMESGLMEKCREKAYFSEKMELHIQASGSTTSNTATDTRNGRMEQNIKVISQRERKRVMAH